MSLFNARSNARSCRPSPASRTQAFRRLKSAVCAALVLAPQSPLAIYSAQAQAQCCGQAVPAPVATQTYRLDFQTVYDEQQMTAYRVSYETVYDTQTYSVQRPVWETQTQERRYTVQRPVWETQNREERFTVMKPVYETQVVDRSYDVTRDIVETASREERFTVMKPVYETAMQQQVSVVKRPVYETSEREEAYTVAEPVTQMRTTYSMGSQAVDTVTPVVTPGATALGFVPGGWAVNPYNGLMQWQRGGYTWMQSPGMVTNQVNRVYQPTVTPVQVPETTMVNRVVTRKVPVQTVRYIDEQVVQQVPVQTMRMVAEEQVRQVPVQTVRKVVERIDNKVPVQTMRMVAEEQVRQVPVQVCKFVTEERVEPVSIQVMKVVTEQRTAQVPRVVEKKVPYTYTVRSPRTVVMRVPLDPCGNPMQATIQQTSAVGSAPAASVSRPASAPMPVPPPALAPAEPAATKTFSDKPTGAAPKAAEGWTGSGLQHVDPKQPPVSGSQSAGSGGATAPGATRVEKPAESAADLRPIENIPTPAAKDAVSTPSPTVAPLSTQPQLNTQPQPNTQPQLGPAVEPAPPAADPKDIPAAETSGRLLRIVPPVNGHTT